MKGNMQIMIDPIKQLLFFFILCVTYLLALLFDSITASAAEKAPGGANNTVVIDSVSFNSRNNVKTIDRRTLIAKDDCEIIGYLVDYINSSTGQVSRSNLKFYMCGKDGFTTLTEHLEDFTGYKTVYQNEELIQSYAHDINTIKEDVEYWYAPDQVITVTCNVTGMKIFKDVYAATAYVESGSLDGMINQDDVDSGSYDSDIGYLHDLKHHDLNYGEQDENGFYENYDERFTWSDYYPEYDESYLVEVRASCEVEVKKWFGVGKSKLYNSDIRQLASGVTYKDLEYIVSLNDEKSLFSDFINEYMPGKDSVSDVISAGSFRFDTFYFRIYRWDEETESFKYGLWVRLTKEGSALMPTLGNTVDAGDFDKEGNFKRDSKSDYGDGKKNETVVGAGSDKDEAKNDADKEQEEKDNGRKPIDLSNTNFQELWEWFCGSLTELWNGLGVIPEFFGRLFSFLPSPVILFIGLGIVVAIILRILGR